jgi:DNA-binding Lrp family transcriptional regulator
MLTDKEFEILKHLRGNSRTTVTEIGRKVNLPRSTVYDKIKKFKREGIVNKYSCLLNFNQLGLPIQVKVLFKADNTSKIKLGETLINSEHTNNVVKLGNEFDYLASFAFKSMDELHKFLDTLTAEHQIRDYRVLYIANELKREGFLL